MISNNSPPPFKTCVYAATAIEYLGILLNTKNEQEKNKIYKMPRYFIEHQT